MQNKLNSHAEKLIIMEKIQTDSTIEESSLSTREIMRGVRNVSAGGPDSEVVFLLFINNKK